jgi:carboxymethylenebutenolidase
MTNELEIKTADGTARAWIYRTPQGPNPGVVFFPDAFGVRPSMHEMAKRLAGLGYTVLLPDVFYRTPFEPFDIPSAWTDQKTRERLMALIYSLTTERIGMDGAAYFDALAAQPGVRADRLGSTGYCMGGRMSFTNACLNPTKVRAAMAFHPGMMVSDKDDSPHKLVGKLEASVYLGVADNDQSFSPEAQAAMATALGAVHARYTMELYAGKRHGYAVPDNAGAYDQEAADQHWRRMESFFGEKLR